jgi:hypothetical protein
MAARRHDDGPGRPFRGTAGAPATRASGACLPRSRRPPPSGPRFGRPTAPPCTIFFRLTSPVILVFHNRPGPHNALPAARPVRRGPTSATHSRSPSNPTHEPNARPPPYPHRPSLHAARHSTRPGITGISRGLCGPRAASAMAARSPRCAQRAVALCDVPAVTAARVIPTKSPTRLPPHTHTPWWAYDNHQGPRQPCAQRVSNTLLSTPRHGGAGLEGILCACGRILPQIPSPPSDGEGEC